MKQTGNAVKSDGPVDEDDDVVIIEVSQLIYSYFRINSDHQPLSLPLTIHPHYLSP